MGAVEPGDARRGLVGRTRELLLRPRAAWRDVAAEAPDVGALYLGYVVPMAAMPALAAFLGVFVFRGYQVAGIQVRPTLAGAAVEALAGFVVTLIGVGVLAWIVDVAAPRFGGTADRGRAFQLVAYSGAGLWVAGVLALYPPLGLPTAVLGALYSLYLLYLGLPRMMRLDPDRAITCFAVVLAGALVLTVLRGMVMAQALELGGPLVAS